MGVADFQPKYANWQSVWPTLRSLGLVLLLALAVGMMAYQSPPTGKVRVGWLGDRLFLGSDPGLGALPLERGDFFADDLTPDSPTGRSRWTREHARVILPNLGAGADLDLVVQAQGWPSDVLRHDLDQPTITVFADGQPVGSFVPQSGWGAYHVRIPAAVQVGGDLQIDLQGSATFTDTLTFGNDPRLKALRLAELRVSPTEQRLLAFYPPAWNAIFLLGLNALLFFLLVSCLTSAPVITFPLTLVAVGLAGVGLAFTRVWMGAALSVTLLAQAGLLLLAWRTTLLAWLRALVRRYGLGSGLGYGLVAAALIWFIASLNQLLAWFGNHGGPLFWTIFPDSLLYSLLGAGLLVLALVLGREGLPRLTDRVVAGLGSPRGAVLLLTTFCLIWIGYEAWVIFQLPYVGHADYSDNAVVARNLVAGRGWVVDYVTQFYTVNAELTRPQETWPLLQPVWIAPFFALFGPTPWAAKLPNLVFNLLLALLIFLVGSRIWDRRVGLTAAIFVLTNYLFFRLTIYATSDLAFVVWCMGAIFCLYQSTQAEAAPDQRWLIAAGLLCGLMMLQKPSGAIMLAGMGLWLLGFLYTTRPHTIKAVITAALSFGLPALIVLAPYVIRNLLLFGKPVFSTESYDAWVLGYRGNSGDAWEEIYRVFTPVWGGPGLPDRSWIMRWGFDATLEKLIAQVRELRNYLMPVWHGAPDGVAWLFSNNERKNIASDLGAWMALIGMIAALRSRRRLVGLLAAAYLPYMVFMITYWRTNEERYWVMLIPWLALLAAWAIWGGYDRLAQIGDRRWAPLGLILVLVAISGVLGFSRPDIAKKVREETAIWAPDLAAYTWIDQHVPADAVLMTRIPWQANWHTQRSTLMIPNTPSRDLLLEIAHHYGADYLVLENQQRVKGDGGRQLNKLLDHGNQVGAVIEGFELVYASPSADFRAFVYRIP
ncbi:ArnT family glycosyltransferase [Candidatus Oscillochloris fontis]|uniref:ArnT family glycosyltransferase n=1 Tax=Candidatus Oscillochloris fontis TaxID=2496868 RepID=UPI00101DC704|nr:glycosyltransferase family 39 protein [Candidatus Oscillochloris fontis]